MPESISNWIIGFMFLLVILAAFFVGWEEGKRRIKREKAESQINERARASLEEADKFDFPIGLGAIVKHEGKDFVVFAISMSVKGGVPICLLNLKEIEGEKKIQEDSECV